MGNIQNKKEIFWMSIYFDIFFEFIYANFIMNTYIIFMGGKPEK